MSLTVIAFGLLFAFAFVLWAALVLWGLICPSLPDDEEYAEREAPAAPPPPVPANAPSVGRAGDDRFPVLVLPEGPPVTAVRLSDAENVVSLSEWRERSERAG